MFKISSLLFVALILGVNSADVTYTSGAYSVTLVDKSGGSLTSSQKQSTVNVFFQVYPSLAAQYSNPPTTVIITIDPGVAQGSLGVGSSGISMSLANVQSNPNDASYMNFGLSYMLSYFYTTKAPGGATTTVKATTKAPVTTAAPSANGMTAALRQLVLDSHNAYRSQLAKGQTYSAAGQMPTATAMNQLKYNTTLEQAGANWMANCPGMVHTPNNPYGQNLAWSSDPNQAGTDAVQGGADMWWEEVDYYPNTDTKLTDEVYNAGPDGTGHFTQMARAKATQVGCAIKRCSDGTYFICNYNEPNWGGGAPIYIAGPTCSQCTTACSSSGNGLCA